ncbi:MAG: hypothetical protein K5739_04480 [Lachnospiraceae bacterium]|nr:hypothetical protein [Lachnospiraceae bacterium]
MKNGRKNIIQSALFVFIVWLILFGLEVIHRMSVTIFESSVVWDVINDTVFKYYTVICFLIGTVYYVVLRGLKTFYSFKHWLLFLLSSTVLNFVYFWILAFAVDMWVPSFDVLELGFMLEGSWASIVAMAVCATLNMIVNGLRKRFLSQMMNEE